ncbi:hypothetical protein AB6A23_14475 [Paenibacillus tarimensis]
MRGEAFQRRRPWAPRPHGRGRGQLNRTDGRAPVIVKPHLGLPIIEAKCVERSQRRTDNTPVKRICGGNDSLRFTGRHGPPRHDSFYRKRLQVKDRKAVAPKSGFARSVGDEQPGSLQPLQPVLFGQGFKCRAVAIKQPAAGRNGHNRRRPPLAIGSDMSAVRPMHIRIRFIRPDHRPLSSGKWSPVRNGGVPVSSCVLPCAAVPCPNKSSHAPYTPPNKGCSKCLPRSFQPAGDIRLFCPDKKKRGLTPSTV